MQISHEFTHYSNSTTVTLRVILINVDILKKKHLTNVDKLGTLNKLVYVWKLIRNLNTLLLTFSRLLFPWLNSEFGLIIN